MTINYEALENGIVILRPDKESWGTGFIVGRSDIGTSGSFVITNTHCLPEVPLAAGDPEYAPVIIHLHRLSGHKEEAKLQVDYADPIGDIAILGSLDDQEWIEETEQYERLIEAAKMVTVNLEDPPDYEEVAWENLPKTRVFLRDSKGSWLTGETFTGRTSILSRGPRMFRIELDNKKAHITAGTSGSPVFNEKGIAIGVLNRGSLVNGEPTPECIALSLPDSLPVWLLDFLRKNRRDKEL